MNGMISYIMCYLLPGCTMTDSPWDILFFSQKKVGNCYHIVLLSMTDTSAPLLMDTLNN